MIGRSARLVFALLCASCGSFSAAQAQDGGLIDRMNALAAQVAAQDAALKAQDAALKAQVEAQDAALKGQVEAQAAALKAQAEQIADLLARLGQTNAEMSAVSSRMNARFEGIAFEMKCVSRANNCKPGDTLPGCSPGFRDTGIIEDNYYPGGPCGQGSLCRVCIATP